MYVGDNYPPVNLMILLNAEAVIPSSPKCFLPCLIANKDQYTKIVSIGPSIMQATFPSSVIMPLQIRLVVDLHHHFASKYLMDTLYQLGFCKSNKEVRRYERSATLTFKQHNVNITLTQKVQSIANNVDQS